MAKKYGPKMSDPRIKRSKERRGCGPLGRYIKHQKGLFTTKKPYSVSEQLALRDVK
jgi:hypothetical protein